MGLSIIAGVVAGVLGALPLMIALRVARAHPTTTTAGAAAQGLVGVLVSLVILVIELVVCSRVAHDSLIPFAVAEIVSLIVVTSVCVAVKVRPKRD